MMLWRTGLCVVALGFVMTVNSQTSQIDPLTSPFAPTPPLTNYVIHIHTPTSTSADPNDSRSDAGVRVLTGSNGQQYVCYVPNRGAPAVVDEKDMQTVAKIGACTTAVASLSACTVLRVDHWSYEICPGESFRQFHEGDAGIETQYLLTRSSTDDDRLGMLEDGRVSFVQTFQSDVEGEQRRAVVRYECPDDRFGPIPNFPASKSHAIVSVKENSPLVYDVLVYARDSRLCNHLQSTSQLLSNVNGTCLVIPDGWWQYQVCLGQQIRQFHADGDKVTAEFLLGTYDWRFGEPVNKRGSYQSYINGDPCDLADGEGRSATVRYECVHDGGPVVKSFREVSTCKYEFVIGTEFICDHPALEPVSVAPQELEPLTIDCHPRTESAR